MDTLSSIFAEKLIYYRTLRGKKQKDLAAAKGVSAGTVSSWESGTYSPKLSTLCKISEYLEVLVGALLGMDNDGSENYTKEERELIEAYRALAELQHAGRVPIMRINSERPGINSTAPGRFVQEGGLRSALLGDCQKRLAFFDKRIAACCSA